MSGCLSDVAEELGIRQEMPDFIRRPFLARDLIGKADAVLSSHTNATQSHRMG